MRKSIKQIVEVVKACPCCGKQFQSKDYFVSRSELHKGWEYRIPCCKSCMEDTLSHYIEEYSKKATENNIDTSNMLVERRAMDRLCMAFDIYYSDSLFESAFKSNTLGSLLSSYMRVANLAQNKGKTYDTTISEKEAIRFSKIDIEELDDEEIEELEISPKTIRFFGSGLEKEDYIFLQEQYKDWTERHECKTKAQEEVFKQLCFNQLQTFKAIKNGEDTKDLSATFQKLLETGKLQPKQNSLDTLSDAQTFGTLLDKWENTRPLPEIDEELKDVDKIGVYLETFFKGHLSKVLNIKNGLSNIYTKFMSRYTVKKPEYDEDNNEALFDAIFGETIDKE